MMISPRRRPFWPYLACFVTILFLLNRHTGFVGPIKLTLSRQSATEQLRSTKMKMFLDTLYRELKLHRPDVSPLKPERTPTTEESDPNAEGVEERKRLDLIKMDTGDKIALELSHGNFAKAARKLALRLPFKKGARGIVMTAGATYLGAALTSLVMIRRSGSRLPVHLFLDTYDQYDAHICDEVLPRMNVECLVMKDLLHDATVDHFQYKVLAILFSPFQEILYLDSDAWPVHNPDYLFTTKPYTVYGLVTWPDFWIPTVSSVFYDIAGLETPKFDGTRSTESGIMLYDKAKHADSLLMSLYYNWYGPDLFYPLFSQGASGEGDKETFTHGAMVMKKQYYNVKTPVWILGRWINDTFPTFGMKQSDPVQDMQRYQQRQAASKDGNNEGIKKLADEDRARTLFIHHNLWKIDLGLVGRPDSPIFLKNQSGHYTRLWGDDDRLITESGFDVEKAMWEQIIQANCMATFLEECKSLRAYYREVFLLMK
jgi:alpha 1,2-mannosyltransferase